MRERHDRLIVLIGVLKLVKAFVLLAAAVSVFATLHDGVRHYLREFAAGSGREVITRYIGNLTSSSGSIARNSRTKASSASSSASCSSPTAPTRASWHRFSPVISPATATCR